MNPKVFMSYSWSSQEHQNFVIDLSEKLMSNGIEVVLDVWDFKEGQDKYTFMEKMVTDSNVSKVLIICDKSYAEKANSKTGGVGTESQIISTETYEKVEQTKFIPVLVEHDENGKPHLPVFLKSRKYIDLSSEGSGDDFETLVRAIYDKPLYKKPSLGKAPSFITDPLQVIPTSGKFLLFKEAIEKDKKTLKGNFIDFLEEAAESIQSEYIDQFKTNTPDEEILESITRLKPLKDQICDAIIMICKYNQVDLLEEMFSFLEKCLECYNVKTTGSSYNYQFDNIKFFTHEFFITMLAILIKYDQINSVKSFIERTYIYKKWHGEKKNRNFDVFKKHLTSLDEVRKNRLNSNRVSITYDLLKERCDIKCVSFDQLMEVELILWFRAIEKDQHWFPGSLIYAERWNPRLELFLRAESKIYFEKIKFLFGVNSIEELKKNFSEIKKKTDLAQWRFERTWEALPIESCLNIDKMATL